MQQKPHPKDVAQICRNGHLILGSMTRFPQFTKSFCTECGAATINECQTCRWPIDGISEGAWMSGNGPYQAPKYCEECGKPFPWTETALSAAKEYTDDIETLSADEKTSLKATFDDLTSDTARTPLAANRVKKFLTKIGPAGGELLVKILVNFATEAAKKAFL